MDEHEEIDETKPFEVKEGSVWERENPDLGEVRLIGCGENEYEWMEISKDILKHHFKPFAHKVKG